MMSQRDWFSVVSLPLELDSSRCQIKHVEVAFVSQRIDKHIVGRHNCVNEVFVSYERDTCALMSASNHAKQHYL